MRHVLARSAVALFLSDHLRDGLSVLIIHKHAEREGDPWSGHMAFPGGRRDPADRNSLATARREDRRNRTGIKRHGRLLTRLSDVITLPQLRGASMVITPYVFQLRAVPELSPNHEVAAIVWVPLAFLAERANRQKMRWAPNGVPIELPCYLYGEYRIWGLSLLMLDELLDVLV